MKTTDAGAARSLEAEEAKEYLPQVEALDVSAEQMEQRALATTEVLNAILGREEEACWRHGGLNE